MAEFPKSAHTLHTASHGLWHENNIHSAHTVTRPPGCVGEFSSDFPSPHYFPFGSEFSLNHTLRPRGHCWRCVCTVQGLGDVRRDPGRQSGWESEVRAVTYKKISNQPDYRTPPQATTTWTGGGAVGNASTGRASGGNYLVGPRYKEREGTERACEGTLSELTLWGTRRRRRYGERIPTGGERTVGAWRRAVTRKGTTACFPIVENAGKVS